MGKVKIIGGTHKGRCITAAVNKTLRPTSSKVRESVFNILRDVIQGCSFLDLYAGSGGVGLEALSRGAQRVVFVDKSVKTIETITSLPLFKIGGTSAAYIGDARSVLKKLENMGETFNCVYVDPPYYSSEIENILPLLSVSKVLTVGSYVLFEHPEKKSLPESIGFLTKKKKYKYGDTLLTVYEFFQD
ncbi:MAG: 16S rRNA (guanine(966)-N(2))-methyltransferase RsmD [Nitrospirae bacterium YQR-1]